MKRKPTVPPASIQATFGEAVNEDTARIVKEGMDLLNTLLRKNADYGSAAWTRPPLAPHLDAGTAILVRMGDKVQRIAKLVGGQSPAVAESLEDTIRDLAGYCILWLARPKEDALDV